VRRRVYVPNAESGALATASRRPALVPLVRRQAGGRWQFSPASGSHDMGHLPARSCADRGRLKTGGDRDDMRALDRQNGSPSQPARWTVRSDSSQAGATDNRTCACEQDCRSGEGDR